VRATSIITSVQDVIIRSDLVLTHIQGKGYQSIRARIALANPLACAANELSCARHLWYGIGS